MNLGAFAVIAALQKRPGVTSSSTRSPGWAGGNRCSASLLTLFLLSLTGIPPTAGFFAKAYVILAAVEAGGSMTVLAVHRRPQRRGRRVLLPARRRLHVHARPGQRRPVDAPRRAALERARRGHRLHDPVGLFPEPLLQVVDAAAGAISRIAGP